MSTREKIHKLKIPAPIPLTAPRSVLLHLHTKIGIIKEKLNNISAKFPIKKVDVPFTNNTKAVRINIIKLAAKGPKASPPIITIESLKFTL